MIRDCIYYYNTQRVQRNLGVVTPMEKYQINNARIIRIMSSSFLDSGHCDKPTSTHVIIACAIGSNSFRFRSMMASSDSSMRRSVFSSVSDFAAFKSTLLRIFDQKRTTHRLCDHLIKNGSAKPC